MLNVIDLARITIGIPLVYLIPGLAWSFVLFPPGRLDSLERGGIAVFLSIVGINIVMFAAHFLIGLPISLVNFALVAVSLTAMPLGFLIVQRRRARLD